MLNMFNRSNWIVTFYHDIWHYSNNVIICVNVQKKKMYKKFVFKRYYRNIL